MFAIPLFFRVEHPREHVCSEAPSFLEGACGHDSNSLYWVGVLVGGLNGWNRSTLMKDICAAGHQKLSNGSFISLSGFAVVQCVKLVQISPLLCRVDRYFMHVTTFFFLILFGHWTSNKPYDVLPFDFDSEESAVIMFHNPARNVSNNSNSISKPNQP